MHINKLWYTYEIFSYTMMCTYASQKYYLYEEIDV